MESHLPMNKLTRAKEALQQWSNMKSATLKELQSLIGTLQFACRAVIPGRAFLQRIITLTKGISNSIGGMSGLTHNSVKTFPCGPLTTGTGLIFLGVTVLSSSDLRLFTDASGPLGYGGYLNGRWFQSRWLPQHCINPATGISIDWQEVFALSIYIACFIWGSQWSGKRICIGCDNLPVVTIINSKRYKSLRAMDLVRAITILTLVHNFTFTAKHIPGLDNSIADSLSHFKIDRFHLPSTHSLLDPSINNGHLTAAV